MTQAKRILGPSSGLSWSRLYTPPTQRSAWRWP